MRQIVQRFNKTMKRSIYSFLKQKLEKKELKI